MNNDGLAVTPEGTTAAPTMYEEIEEIEDVARGHVRVKEIIAYDFVEKRKVIERDKMGNEIGSKMVIIENSRPPYFCQTKEQEVIFKENNPDARTESFGIQLLKSTAIKYLNEPRNVEQFMRKEEIAEISSEEPNWREQAKQLGIPMYQRTKEDVLADIARQTTTSVS